MEKWTSDENGIIDNERGEHVASVAPKNRKANTCLIVAAPDLLEAAKEVFQISQRKHNAWDRLDNAMRRAEGKE